MEQRSKRDTALVVFIVAAGIVLAIANVGVLLITVPHGAAGTWVSPFTDLYQLCPPCVMYFTAAPLLLALLLAVIVRQRSATAQTGSAAGAPPALVPTALVPAAPGRAASATPSPAPALRLLGLLQQEGRFVDFIAEDIDAYSDAQVGAAVRAIHANCRKALNERVTLERILTAEEGSEVVIEQGFDPAAVRLTGNVAGTPPFRGTLQHAGWRVTKVALPESPGGIDPNIIAPAEVEIP